ncbi:LysM peptidoglycan-binding domain-containing protein [Phosphitispora fastidiosa]|uniref:LysM peptidoglycan-binding domain-containing protein n=1 Tax=Phosphitispora fastidiosa TaxID=2837202 RepID=UPI001E291BD6|nr:LysM domain-containing protein [Phosphitispora fastidiosa]MBU7005785.1 LysM repeat protein [Phosphitispora fastidiosa]
MTDKIESNQVPSCPGGTLYTIIPGDSYFGLATRFNVTVDALIAANPGADPQNLQIGQQICIPGVPAGTPCPGGFLYVIKPGDTYYSIARRFGTVVPALIAANPGVDPDSLVIGQSICIPAAQPVPCPGGRFYTIVSGDTLFSIARRFNTTVNALITANQGIDPNNLSIGQVICIPV